MIGGDFRVNGNDIFLTVAGRYTSGFVLLLFNMFHRLKNNLSIIDKKFLKMKNSKYGSQKCLFIKVGLA